MTFEAFQSYIKENVLKEWREDADIEMAVVRKNNGIELCGLYIRGRKNRFLRRFIWMNIILII